MKDDMAFFERFSEMYLHGFKNLADFFAEPAAQHGITLDEFYILHDIAEAKNNIRLMDIADSHDVTRSAISRLIGRLLRRNYIFQEAEDHDRRNKVLKLTSEGSKIERTVYKELLERNNSWSATFDRDKQNQTLNLVSDFMSQFVNKTAESTDRESVKEQA